ncbi:MAG: hypothetical protein AB8B63_17220 [Granulosicoccus sp.]
MLATLGYTVVLTIVFCALVLGGLWFAYRSTWRGPKRWMEASRHQHRLALIVGRWIWFRWIHLDCQYWILHLDFRAGPVELRGLPPEGSYWSFTYNTWTEVNPSVNSQTASLEEDGTYRITLDKTSADGNWIKVRDNAGLGVIYFRIYESSNFPAALPSVWQNGELLARYAGS